MLYDHRRISSLYTIPFLVIYEWNTEMSIVEKNWSAASFSFQVARMLYPEYLADRLQKVAIAPTHVRSYKVDKLNQESWQ